MEGSESEVRVILLSAIEIGCLVQSLDLTLVLRIFSCYMIHKVTSIICKYAWLDYE